MLERPRRSLRSAVGETVLQSYRLAGFTATKRWRTLRVVELNEKEKIEYGSRLRLVEPARVDGRSSSAAKAADSSYGFLTTRKPQ